MSAKKTTKTTKPIKTTKTTKTTTKTFTTTISRSDRVGATCFLPLPFDPIAVFGQAHAPVVVTMAGGYRYRSTITTKPRYGRCVPLRTSHREAAGVEVGQAVRVTMELDVAPREVAAPVDLVEAIAAAGARVAAAWEAMSYSHQREHVDAIEKAVKPETRARRIAAAVTMIQAKAKTTKTKTKT